MDWVVVFGNARIKAIPLIIPRRYMSREILRDFEFDFVGDFCCGCWFGVGGDRGGGCWFGVRA